MRQRQFRQQFLVIEEKIRIMPQKRSNLLLGDTLHCHLGYFFRGG
jgi:hypothetical protein